MLNTRGAVLLNCFLSVDIIFGRAVFVHKYSIHQDIFNNVLALLHEYDISLYFSYC